jgi:tetrahydromethanopterin:alpha-L-glutamate ligase
MTAPVVTQGSPSADAPCAVIFTDEPGWHGRRLCEAFAALGWQSRPVSLTRCVLGTGGVQLPGFNGRLPDAAFVRGVPGGSLAQVIHRLNVLHELAARGVPVVNDGRSIECTVDKSMTTLRIREAGLPTPATWVGEGERGALRFLRRELAAGYRVVMKPVFGSQGEGVVRLDSIADLPPAGGVDGLYYLQRFVEAEGEHHADIRVLVVAGRAVAAMRRESTHWVTNRAQGARCLSQVMDESLARLAEAAVVAVGAVYAGVDILVGPGGTRYVGEVNGIPAWYGLQRVTPTIDIAALLAQQLVAQAAAGDLGHQVA